MEAGAMMIVRITYLYANAVRRIVEFDTPYGSCEIGMLWDDNWSYEVIASTNLRAHHASGFATAAEAWDAARACVDFRGFDNLVTI